MGTTPLPPQPQDPEPRGRPFVWLLAALVVGPLWARLKLLHVRGFNPDEFEHLHASWLVASGHLPYRDFFEHHTPGLYYLLAPPLRALDVEGSVTDALKAILWARGAMWIFAAGVLGLVFWFGRQWRGTTTAWISALLLGNAAIFVGKTLEIRPDVPALACYAAALVLCLGGLTVRRSTTASRSLGLAGVFLSAAVLFTQKTLFLLPGFLVVLVWWLRNGRDRPYRFRSALVALAGFALPLGLTAAFFWREGGLRALVELGFGLNARWKHRLGPGPLFQELLRQEALLLALALIGTVGALRAVGRARDGRPETTVGYVLLGGCLTSVVMGAFVIPVVHRQYALLALPPLALLAGAGLADLAHHARARGWWPPLVLAVAVVGSSGPSARRLYESFGRTNGAALENIRYVQRNVSATETVLDGFSGEGVFRPHAYYYFFLHEEIRKLVEPDDLLARLQRGEIAPKVVLFDRHLQEWSPALASFLSTHYADIGQPPIRVRLFDNGQGLWNEEGWRRLAGPAGPALAEPHLFTGEGWRRVEVEGGRAFRRSRGRRSALTLPVRDEGAFVLVLSARPNPSEHGVDLEVVANGKPLGRRALPPGWRESEWSVPLDVLHHGLNEIVLVPSADDSSRQSAPAEVAVEALKLTRRRVSSDLAKPGTFRADRSARP